MTGSSLEPPERFAVGTLARMAGVTVRTLHHYDELGLLPARRDERGHRVYGPDDLHRLRTILLYAELEIPLAEIRTLLQGSRHDRILALRRQRDALLGRRHRLDRLLEALERSLEEEGRAGPLLSDTDLYPDVPRDEALARSREARSRWPETYAAVDDRLRGLGPEEAAALRAEGEAVARGLAALVGRSPGDPAVQELVARHHAWVEAVGPVDAVRYRSLARVYLTDRRFTRYYEGFGAGVTDLLTRAMEIHARTLADRGDEG